MIAASVAGSIAFYFYEKRRHAAGKSELLPVSLMTNGNFVLGTVMALTFFSGVAGFFLVLAVFLQTGFGLSPLQSGLTTVPFPLGVLIASIVSAKLGSRWPRQRIAAGAILLVVGMVILRFVVGGVGEAVDHWRFVAPLFLSGLGMGAAIAPLFQTVLWTVPQRDAGSAPARCSRSSRSAARSASRSPARFSFPRWRAGSHRERQPIPPSSTACRGHCSTRWRRLQWSPAWCSFSARLRRAREAGHGAAAASPAAVEA